MKKTLVEVEIPEGVDPAIFLHEALGNVRYRGRVDDGALLVAARYAREKLQALVDDPAVIRGVIPRQDAAMALQALREALRE